MKTPPSLSVVQLFECTGLPNSFAWIRSRPDESLSLYLFRSAIDDALLRTLDSNLPIDVLCLSHNPAITDAGINHLEHWRGLPEVDLAKTGITDASVPTLVKLRPEKLNISGTKITAAGIAQLVSVPELRELTCDGGMIDDEVAAVLENRKDPLRLIIHGDAIALRRLQCEWDGPAPPMPPRGPVPAPPPPPWPEDYKSRPPVDFQFKK